MNFHPDDFLSLIEEAERQGGAHLNEVCKPDTFRLDLPIDEDKPQGPKHSVKLATTGCRRRAKFLVPLLPDAYLDQVDVLDATGKIGEGEDFGNRTWREPTDEDFDFRNDHPHQAMLGDGSPMLAKVCAVDDAMGLWPRFKDAMITGESFQE
jgi:hypothetical protein